MVKKYRGFEINTTNETAYYAHAGDDVFLYTDFTVSHWDDKLKNNKDNMNKLTFFKSIEEIEQAVDWVHKNKPEDLI